MSKIFLLISILAISLETYSQMQAPIIPITKESGIYEIKSNTFSLITPITYETLFADNEDASPNMNDFYYNVKMDDRVIFKVHGVFKDKSLCITTTSGKGDNYGYTCIGFDKFAESNDNKSAQLCIVGETKQLRVLYYKDMKAFFLIDIPTEFNKKSIVIHFLVNAL